MNIDLIEILIVFPKLYRGQVKKDKKHNDDTMVLILDGSSEIVAHVRSNLC